MPADDSNSRICRWCGAPKLLTDFPLIRGKRFRKCKKCTNEQVQAWVEKNRERSQGIKQAFVQRHPDRYLASKHKHYFSNRSDIIRREVERKRAKKEHVNACYRAQYAKEPDKWKRRQRRYENKNPERVKAIHKATSARRRIRISTSESNYTAADVLRLYAEQDGKCSEPSCRKSLKLVYHVDHIVAIALGGSNGPDNIQLLCPRCNSRKWKLHTDEWARRNGRLF